MVSQHPYEVDASRRRVNCAGAVALFDRDRDPLSFPVDANEPGNDYGCCLVTVCGICGLPPPPPLRPPAATPCSVAPAVVLVAVCPWFAQPTRLRVAQIAA